MAEFCIHEKHGGVCNLTGEYCSLGSCPNEDIEEFAPLRHGRWVEKEKYTFGIMYDCSLCENRILDNGHSWNYCPNCGAKMDESTD